MPKRYRKRGLRRPVRRRRGYTRRRSGARRLKKAINLAIQQRAEVKRHIFYQQPYSFTTSRQSWHLLGINFSQGEGGNEFIGNKIRLKTISLRGEVYNLDTANNIRYRLIAGYWLDADTSPDPTLVLQNIDTPYNVDAFYQDRSRMFWKTKYDTGAQHLAANQAANQYRTKQIHFKIKGNGKQLELNQAGTDMVPRPYLWVFADTSAKLGLCFMVCATYTDA